MKACYKLLAAFRPLIFLLFKKIIWKFLDLSKMTTFNLPVELQAHTVLDELAMPVT